MIYHSVIKNMIAKNIIDKARKLAFEEIEKYDSPNLIQFNIANSQGQRLAREYKVNKDIVLLGTIFMDFKIGQAIEQGRIKEHIQMSAKAARLFLENEKIVKESSNNIINCVLSHHRDIPFATLEAEVCANADCYRFLTPLGALSFINQLTKERMSLDEAIDYLNSKLDEKWNIASLPSVRKELGPNHKFLKELVQNAKINSAEIIEIK